ncbi:hypothetical protein ABI_17540 [Asticcacaulis biprosthecium C19]|uniref:Uncharacterized protein n=1 Tax=Asticcacaulis biprosthecium C19 TaxID=715226 RepID=F4QKD6_9CAUL|nr:hypothetical protein ABI_17540 [Asticcacaulis biprosthecium C19]
MVAAKVPKRNFGWELWDRGMRIANSKFKGEKVSNSTNEFASMRD